MKVVKYLRWELKDDEERDLSFHHALRDNTNMARNFFTDEEYKAVETFLSMGDIPESKLQEFITSIKSARDKVKAQVSSLKALPDDQKDNHLFAVQKIGFLQNAENIEKALTECLEITIPQLFHRQNIDEL